VCVFTHFPRVCVYVYLNACTVGHFKWFWYFKLWYFYKTNDIRSIVTILYVNRMVCLEVNADKTWSWKIKDIFIQLEIWGYDSREASGLIPPGCEAVKCYACIPAFQRSMLHGAKPNLVFHSSFSNSQKASFRLWNVRYKQNGAVSWRKCKVD